MGAQNADKEWRPSPHLEMDGVEPAQPGRVEVVAYRECPCGKRVPADEPCPRCGRRLLLD